MHPCMVFCKSYKWKRESTRPASRRALSRDRINAQVFNQFIHPIPQFSPCPFPPLSPCNLHISPSTLMLLPSVFQSLRSHFAMHPFLLQFNPGFDLCFLGLPSRLRFTSLNLLFKAFEVEESLKVVAGGIGEVRVSR